MKNDRILEIGIDSAGSIYVTPATSAFPHIYLEAMEVGWDGAHERLFGPRPKDWTYLDWFRQIIAAAKAQGVLLQVGSDTRWSNIDSSLRQKIERESLG